MARADTIRRALRLIGMPRRVKALPEWKRAAAKVAAAIRAECGA
jgi:hypothetical protein